MVPLSPGQPNLPYESISLTSLDLLLKYMILHSMPLMARGRKPYPVYSILQPPYNVKLVSFSMTHIKPIVEIIYKLQYNTQA